MGRLYDSDKSVSDEDESVSPRKPPNRADTYELEKFTDEDESVSPRKAPNRADTYELEKFTDEDESVSPRKPPNRADTYELEKFKTNLLVIFNHMEFSDYRFRTRIGTEIDEQSLLKTFEKLNFECLTYMNLSRHAIIETMENLGKKDLTDYGCVFVAIMTHGDDRGLLQASDHSYSEHELVECLSGNHTLMGKPVVFLIQASRGIAGNNLEISVKSFYDENFGHKIKSDILIFYSSPIGQPSFRRHDGSFFIQSLCKQIDLLADKEDFESICRAVRLEFALDIEAQMFVKMKMKAIKQRPVLTSMLIRRLYLGKQVKETYSVAVSYPDLNAPTYELEKKKKNLMIIFSHENFLNNTRRESSAADAKKLKNTFEEFGFEVTTHKDENMTDLFEKLTKFSRQDFSACGCVCVAVLTHGSAHGFLEACDVGYSERALFAAFDALANRSLAGKPIVFLIQASRGARPAGRICVPRLDELPDSSVQLDSAGGSQAAYQIKYLPTEANMIIFHSCFRGRAVPKDDRSGSCFVQTLCDQVRRHGGSEHLEKIFRRVRRLVAETSPQMPVTSSTLLKKLFLQRNSPV